MTAPPPRIPLPAAHLRVPLAHRGLHDAGRGRPENSRSAVRAAAEAGYGIEIDLRLSSDGVPIVFHDAGLARLTGETGPLSAKTAAALGAIRLRGSDETIPSLAQILAEIAGRAPLLIELKDRDGNLAPSDGALERATARALAGYGGPVAVMSFNPAMVAAMGRAAPDLPRGLVTCAFDTAGWPALPAPQRDRLRGIADFGATGAAFVSHDARDLGRPRLAELRQAGHPVLCWTIRSPEAERAARALADQITFEGYPAALAGGGTGRLDLPRRSTT